MGKVRKDFGTVSLFYSLKESDEIEDGDSVPVTRLVLAILRMGPRSVGSTGSLCLGIVTVCFEVVQRSTLASF